MSSTDQLPSQAHSSIQNPSPTVSTIAERANQLLADKVAMEQALSSAIQEHPELARGTLGDQRKLRPDSNVHEEIVAALKYITLCRESKTAEGYSGTMKSRAQRWAGRYVSKGAMITAALMAGANIERQPPDDSHAYIFVTEPRRCWRNDKCKGLIPKDNSERICDDCRLELTEDADQNHIVIFARERFWAWVCNRKDGENPRGDFIRDTRDILSTDVDPESRLSQACIEAQREHDLLWRKYLRDHGLPKNLNNTRNWIVRHRDI